MTSKLKVHFADLIYGRACCGAEHAAALTREVATVTCRRCRAIVAKCEQSEAQRAEGQHG